MRIHHGKHHAGYVKNLNDLLKGQNKILSMSVEDIICDLSVVPKDIRTKVKNNAGGHVNHSLFWTVMAPKSGGNPTGEVAKAIDGEFGSFEKFRDRFSSAGLGRFGSGWVFLVRDANTLAIVDTPNQDSPLSTGKTPILCLDVWEHAYYLKYRNMRAQYIKNWWSVVNWSEVGKLYTSSA